MFCFQDLKFGLSEKATKLEKNLYRLFDKCVMFCPCALRRRVDLFLIEIQNMGAKQYLSKSQRRFLKSNVVKLNYSNFTDL